MKWIPVAFLIGVLLWYIIFKTDIAIRSFRVVCDLRDQIAFNSIIDTLSSCYYGVDARYTETVDTIVLDVYCMFFVYKKLKNAFKAIPNTEVY